MPGGNKKGGKKHKRGKKTDNFDRKLILLKGSCNFPHLKNL